MYQLKTKETESDVQAVVNRIGNPVKKKDAVELIAIFSAVTGDPPKVWGEKQIGFGRYRYKYTSGHRGEFYQTGFSVAEAKISLYLYLEEGARADLLRRLGKATAGKSCVYINKLDDIDTKVLREMIAQTVRFVNAEYPDETKEEADGE